MAKELTLSQSAILRYVMGQTEVYGTAPTMREISIMFGFRSTRGAEVHLDALRRKGYISRSSAPRGIRVLLDPTGQPVTLRYVPTSSIVIPVPESQPVPL